MHYSNLVFIAHTGEVEEDVEEMKKDEFDKYIQTECV